MGTNYYLIRDVCPHCGRGDPRIHIGKSSAGWCFSLHVSGGESWDENPKNLDEWRQRWTEHGVLIVDEYGKTVEPAEMERVILERSRGDLRKQPGYWYAANHASPGPNGLARHQIDGRHCIGHGDGTYDLCPGEFS